jgi:hypothetical protein
MGPWDGTAGDRDMPAAMEADLVHLCVMGGSGSTVSIFRPPWGESIAFVRLGPIASRHIDMPATVGAISFISARGGESRLFWAMRAGMEG